ncbi:hypothetical protein OG352_23305 [Streptomyces sp. NBC_01485]|uniref:hypothetical protein n=1 Tax=Streptomyces sp. NBC_01485 TaxID=2903884 RepID=UPI002E329B58|nr:hypothetical protein [Streptomyces sp. NBC_01485]
MDLPAEGKRSGLLALAVLGVLLVAVLTVFTVFDGDEGSGDGGSAAPSATSGGQDAANPGAGSDGTREPSGGATPIVALTEVAAAHEVMTKYMAGVSTYDHASKPATWSAPLLALTTGETQMEQATALPTGKDWARCEADRCSSKGTATVERDAMISDDLVRDSGRSISSVVSVTAARTVDGKTVTESNKWLVTVKEESGAWVVSGFDIFGLGDVGASDESGE